MKKIVILHITTKIKSLPYVSTKSQFEIDFQDADGARYILVKITTKTMDSINGNRK